MKRIVFGLAVAAAAAMAAPASAHPVEVEECYQTIHMPCGVCVTVAGTTHCHRT